MSRAAEGQSLRGRVWITLKDARTGEVLDRREVHNVVMTGGSELVARRFCGEPAQPISAVGVGEDDTDPTARDLTDLKAPVVDDQDRPERTEVYPPVEGGSYVATDPDTHSATVRFGATFAEDRGNGALKEAGVFNELEAGGILYNRITFPVINKGDTHELTLMWEVTFSG